MELNYIEENLNIIMQDPNSVLYLKPYDVGNKKALFAIVKEDQGVYKKVQITKEQSKLTFPFELLFYNGPGYFYLKNFIVLNGNWIALNIKNLEGFKFKESGKNKKNVDIYATFADGTATFIIRESLKKFKKHSGINLYIDLLKQYKDYEPQYDNYYVIDFYCRKSDIFVIPELLSPISISLSKIDYQDLNLQYNDANVDELKGDVRISPEEVKESVKFFSRLKYK